MAAPARGNAPVTLSLVALAGFVSALAPASACAAEQSAYPQGAAAFQSNCALCHGAAGDGKGGEGQVKVGDAGETIAISKPQQDAKAE